MKKLILAILMVILIAQPFSVNAQTANTYGNLEALGITAEELGAADMNAPATRKALAYIASKLADGNTYKETETSFIDVTKQTGLTGYIANVNNLRIMTGIGENMFAPDELVTSDAVYRVFSAIAGYDGIAEICGGYPEGYREAARHLGITKYIIAASNITLEELFAATDAFLENEYAKLNFHIRNGSLAYELDREKISILTEKHGINVYRGVITGIYDDSFSATIKITENVFESNTVYYEKGASVTVPSNKNINLYEFENAPVTIWIKNDEKIVHVELQKNVEILFGTVYSVNSDTNGESEYMPSYIENISLYNDRKNYRTTDDFNVRYNFSKTKAPVKLVNKFVKMVVYDNKIMFLETWDLSEGGIITEVATDHISYTQGDVDSKRISDIDLLEKLIIYSDKSSVDIYNLKPNTYFDFYRFENQLVIVASEKRITDMLVSLSTDEVQLGNGRYENSGKVYIQDENGLYQENGDCIHLYNKTVTAYFDAKGCCRYIGIADGDNLKRKKFLGVILRAWSDDFEDKKKIKVLPLEGDHEIRTLKLRKKCRLNCGKTLDEILAIRDTTYAENVLEFILNDKDEIIEINSPELFYGFTTAKKVISQFTDDQTPYVEVDGQYLYFKNAPIAILLEDDGELYVKDEVWNNLYGERANNVTMTFYGSGMTSNIRLVLISGNTKSISSKYTDYGFVVKHKPMVNDDMEQVHQITVTSGSQKDFIVTDDVIADIAAGNSDGRESISKRKYFINYSTLGYDKANAIEINSSVWLEDIFDDPTRYGWRYGTVYKADSKRLYIVGSPVEAYFYHNSNIAVSVEEDGMLENINVADISAGDEVYVKRDTEGIKGIIVKK